MFRCYWPVRNETRPVSPRISFSLLRTNFVSGRQCALVVYVYHSQVGDWVIDVSQQASDRFQLHLHTRDGKAERVGIYNDLEQAAGAVQCQLTGLACWDSLPAIPAQVSDFRSWERAESYP